MNQCFCQLQSVIACLAIHSIIQSSMFITGASAKSFLKIHTERSSRRTKPQGLPNRKSNLSCDACLTKENISSKLQSAIKKNLLSLRIFPNTVMCRELKTPRFTFSQVPSWRGSFSVSTHHATLHHPFDLQSASRGSQVCKVC